VADKRYTQVTGEPAPDGVELRPVCRADLPVLFKQQRNPAAIRMAGYRPRSLEAFMEHWDKVLSDESTVKMSIFWRGKIAGNIVVFDVGQNRSVGYWLGKAYWGKGIASDALTQLLGLVTHRPLYAYVAAHNIASQKVLAKCGFQALGRVDTPQGLTPLDGEEWLMRLD
jgi:RimJ/RimL family protein N-acetyltransferase